MVNKWSDESRDNIMSTIMDIAANLEENAGVIILRRLKDGALDTTWAGSDGFSQIDVIGMTAIFQRRQHDCISYQEPKDDPDS
jgi:hypothetical protein